MKKTFVMTIDLDDDVLASDEKGDIAKFMGVSKEYIEALASRPIEDANKAREGLKDGEPVIFNALDNVLAFLEDPNTTGNDVLWYVMQQYMGAIQRAEDRQERASIMRALLGDMIDGM